jgi:hypothetical protein
MAVTLFVTRPRLVKSGRFIDVRTPGKFNGGFWGAVWEITHDDSAEGTPKKKKGGGGAFKVSFPQGGDPASKGVVGFCRRNHEPRSEFVDSPVGPLDSPGFSTTLAKACRNQNPGTETGTSDGGNHR